MPDAQDHYRDSLQRVASKRLGAVVELGAWQYNSAVLAAAAHRAGVTKTEIAELFGITRPTLDDWIKTTPNLDQWVAAYEAAVAAGDIKSAMPALYQ